MKGKFGRPKYKWKDNIKIEIKEVKWKWAEFICIRNGNYD